MPSSFYENVLYTAQRWATGLCFGLGFSLALTSCGQKGDLYLPNPTVPTLNKADPTTADPTTRPTNQTLANNPNVTYQRSSQPSSDPASPTSATPTTSATPIDPAMIQEDRNAY